MWVCICLLIWNFSLLIYTVKKGENIFFPNLKMHFFLLWVGNNKRKHKFHLKRIKSFMTNLLIKSFKKNTKLKFLNILLFVNVRDATQKISKKKKILHELKFSAFFKKNCALIRFYYFCLMYNELLLI